MEKLMEKRHHERMNHNTMATLEFLDIGAITKNRMLNCSNDGLYFESDQLLSPGTEVFIRIDNTLNSPSGATSGTNQETPGNRSESPISQGAQATSTLVGRRKPCVSK